MKKPCLSQLWLFVVQQAEAAALSLGFSLSKVLVRFAAQTYFAAYRPHISAPPPTHTHLPIPLTTTPPPLLPLSTSFPSPLSLSLTPLTLLQMFWICFLSEDAAQTAKCRQNAPQTSPAVTSAPAVALANGW